MKRSSSVATTGIEGMGKVIQWLSSWVLQLRITESGALSSSQFSSLKT